MQLQSYVAKSKAMFYGLHYFMYTEIQTVNIWCLYGVKINILLIHWSVNFLRTMGHDAVMWSLNLGSYLRNVVQKLCRTSIDDEFQWIIPDSFKKLNFEIGKMKKK